MEKNYKVIVAHPAQQHSYKTAAALKKSGLLFKYATTVYRKEKSFTSIITRFLKGDNFKRAVERRTDELEDSDVIQFCELEGLFLLFLARIDKSKFFYLWWNRFIIKKFSKKIANYAIRNNVDIVIVYDTVSSYVLRILNNKAPNIIKILDMSAPNFAYMDNIFKNDIKKDPKYASDLINKVSTYSYNRTLDDSLKEITLADYFLVASKFTEISLLYSGIPKEKIFKCSYGFEIQEVDIQTVLANRKYDAKKLKCIFVGRVTQEKGAHYLFNAIERLNLDDFSFKFVGTYDNKSVYYENFKSICEFDGHVTKDKMVSIYSNSHILVFPSLADGFGLTVLEALSFGIPVICSSNAGASELIVDGYNGFIVSPGDEKAIYEKLNWFNNNRNEIKKMSKNAIQSVSKNTWGNYNKKLKKIIKDIMQE